MEHEFFCGVFYNVKKWRNACISVMKFVDSENSLEMDFLNPFGFEHFDNDKKIIKNDLRRFYIYFRTKYNLSIEYKIFLIDAFILKFSEEYPLFYEQVSVLINGKRNTKIELNECSYRKHKNRAKLLCINILKSDTPLINYYSDYIIASIYGFMSEQSIEYQRYSLSYTKNLRAIQLYIIVEYLFRPYLSSPPDCQLDEIVKSLPSTSIMSYFEYTPNQFDTNIRDKIVERYREIYNRITNSSELITLEIMDMNDEQTFLFNIEPSIYRKISQNIINSYTKYEQQNYESN